MSVLVLQLSTSCDYYLRWTGSPSENSIDFVRLKNGSKEEDTQVRAGRLLAMYYKDPRLRIPSRSKESSAREMLV